MKLPLELNEVERTVVAALLDRAAAGAQIYSGDFSAPWLLSTTIYCDVWSLRKGDDETREVDGVVVGVRNFEWRVKLPNGTNLCDEVNTSLRQSMQRIGFIARTMPGGPDTLLTHLNFLWSLTFFARWMFLQEANLDPANRGFRGLTHEHCADIVRGLATGGVAFALQCPQRMLSVVFPIALGRPPSDEELESPMSLDVTDCQTVRAWFEASGYLKTVKRQDRPDSINRLAVANLIGVDLRTLTGNAKFGAFLNQFTDGPLKNQVGAFRGKADSRREFASHRSMAVCDVAVARGSENSVNKYLTDLKTLFSLERHIPDDCPNPSEFRSKRLGKLVTEVCRPSQTTPWVPIKTALTYTTESLRWIHVYGSALVDVFLDVYADLHGQGLLAPPPTGTDAEQATAYKNSTAAREACIARVRMPNVLAPLNISGWASYIHLDGGVGFEKLRRAPSLLDAIMVLIAAIAILTATMKPMRESELRRLRRGCVFFKKGDGYWISASQKKRSISGIDPRLHRPIPSIVARALMLQQRLTDGLKAIVGVSDAWLLENLFALPCLGRYEAKISDIMSAGQLNQVLDTFCDYVALPADAAGRRWYIRIHELRKSFLIVFFWTYRYANLEAAAWMAGHTDVSQLYAYLQVNFPGQELPTLEAEYASQVLRAQGDSLLARDLEHVDLLHNAVCKHFAVSDVSWIDERALREWLTTRFASGDFQITPYSLPQAGNGPEVHIAFRIRT